MKIISSCRVCKSRNIQEFFDLGEQPLANSLPKSLDIKERFYPLSLSWCADCNLVQLNQTINPEELFSWVRVGECQFMTLDKTNEEQKMQVALEYANSGILYDDFIKNPEILKQCKHPWSR